MWPPPFHNSGGKTCSTRSLAAASALHMARNCPCIIQPPRARRTNDQQQHQPPVQQQSQPFIRDLLRPLARNSIQACLCSSPCSNRVPTTTHRRDTTCTDRHSANMVRHCLNKVLKHSWIVRPHIPATDFSHGVFLKQRNHKAPSDGYSR